MLQDASGACTTYGTLQSRPTHSPSSISLVIAPTLSVLPSALALALVLASSYTQCLYRQSMCEFLPPHPHTFISVARLVPAWLPVPLLKFAPRIRNCGVMYISYSVVPKEKEYFDSCHVCRLLPGLAKKVNLAVVRLDEGPEASTTPTDSVINRHVLQLNFVSSQSTEYNKMYSASSREMYHRMSRLYTMLNTK